MSLLISKGVPKSDIFLLQGFVHAFLSRCPRWPERFRILIPLIFTFDSCEEIPGLTPAGQEGRLYFFLKMLIIVQKDSTKKNLLASP